MSARSNEQHEKSASVADANERARRLAEPYGGGARRTGEAGGRRRMEAAWFRGADGAERDAGDWREPGNARDCPDAATYALPEGQAKADVLSTSLILREGTRLGSRMRVYRTFGSMSGAGSWGSGYNSGIGNQVRAAEKRFPLWSTDTVPILDSVDSWKRGETPKSR
jgi:hypothetical protein